ncbi:MAG: HAMP domain-containing histidine kinase [Candidatus Obscuribacterales bacterium]|nr:HAMP domain-containing histidine kinase [Candidatus Obscuribacterales bacterium]
MPPEEQSAEASSSGSSASHNNWIAEVSHELRLPLANIKLLVETLLSGALDEPVTARRMLVRADEEVTRLQNLVSDLLSHEKLSRARGEGSFSLVAFADIDGEQAVKAAVETTESLALSKGVKIACEVSKGATFRADADQLHQVLVNLLENAIKFTDAGGLVTVRVRPFVLEVEDTGIGIAEVEIPKIFQRFYRVDRSKTRGSTGLGLSIVKHIVDLHGAKINVYSQEGCGSRFSIEFPGASNFSES